MDIHKPKAAHSWREFLIEIGTIICGILIALGLEQGVEQLHWRHAVEQARETLREEVSAQASFYDLRVQVAGCVDRHIAQVSDLIERVARDGRKPEVTNVPLVVNHGLVSSEWVSERSAQTLVHFPHHERKLLSVFYTLTEDIIPWRDEEGRIWDQLAVLEGPPRHVGESEIATLRYSVIRAKRLAYLIQLNAGRQLRRAHEIGVSHWEPHPSLEKDRRNACSDVRIGSAS